MNRKNLSILIIFALSLSSIPFGIFAISVVAKPTNSLPEYQGVDWKSGLAGDMMMPEKIGDLLGSASASSMPQTAVSEDDIGMVVWDYYLAFYAQYGIGSPYMTLRALSGNAEVWVANDLLYYEGDPRNNPTEYNLTITDDMCQYLANEFDSVIYPATTENFGVPFDRDGTGNVFGYDWVEAVDNPQRTIIKVLNIYDQNYEDPTYPYYVIGFFNPTYDSWYDRNMIHIDAWQWWLRVGDLGTSWFPEAPDLVVDATHDNDYESTIAHEYQHLIHSDYNPNDDDFMNEGCSMYAEEVCGYGIDVDYFNSYFATPDNSLTVWGDQGDINILADYGVTALWAIYLSDHYGGADFIRYFVQAGIPGIEGINAALKYFHYKKASFNTIFHDWRLANLIRSKACGDKYGYKSIDLNSPEVIPLYMNSVTGKFIPWTRGTDFGNTVTILGYDTGVSMIGPFGSDYIKFDNHYKLKILAFDGDDTSVVPGWTKMEIQEENVIVSYWYAGDSNLLNTLIAAEVVVPETDPTLTIVTDYYLEDYWDFGFVQVSTDGGSWESTWTSLANEYTTEIHDSSAIITAVNNLPGLTGPSGGQISMDFDLSAYAGQTIHIGFRCVTDWGYVEAGWLLFDALINDDTFFDSIDYVYPQARFMVTVVEQRELRNGKFVYKVNEMWICDDGNFGIDYGLLSKNENLILIVSPIMLDGFTDYRFKAWGFDRRCHW